MADKQLINYFELRQNLVILFAKVFVLEVALSLLFLVVRAVYQSFFDVSLDTTTLDFFIVYLVLQFINICAIMIVAVLWTNKFYRISPDSVSAHEGWISKKTDIISMRTISSVNLKQSFIGRIFNYGTIRVECMFSHQVIYIRHITKPHFFRKAIQNLIADAIQKNPIAERQNV